MLKLFMVDKTLVDSDFDTLGDPLEGRYTIPQYVTFLQTLPWLKEIPVDGFLYQELDVEMPLFLDIAGIMFILLVDMQPGANRELA